MILTEEEVNERLSSKDNLINQIEIRPMRAEQDTTARVPDLVKALLANVAIESGSIKDTAEAFGVSSSSVSRYSRGMVGDEIKKDLKSSTDIARELREGKIEDKKSLAHSMALDGLIDSLVLLKPSIIKNQADMKPGVIAKIASDMSKISKNLEKEESVRINNTQVILYQPNQRKESAYETIDA